MTVIDVGERVRYAWDDPVALEQDTERGVIVANDLTPPGYRVQWDESHDIEDLDHDSIIRA
jgi:hypothetical protein